MKRLYKLFQFGKFEVGQFDFKLILLKENRTEGPIWGFHPLISQHREDISRFWNLLISFLYCVWFNIRGNLRNSIYIIYMAMCLMDCSNHGWRPQTLNAHLEANFQQWIIKPKHQKTLCLAFRVWFHEGNRPPLACELWWWYEAPFIYDYDPAITKQRAQPSNRGHPTIPSAVRQVSNSYALDAVVIISGAHPLDICPNIH